MVNVANYVEFKAKALIKELAENFDIRKCAELYQTVGDLLKLESETEFKKTGFMMPNSGTFSAPIADAKAKEPDTHIAPRVIEWHFGLGKKAKDIDELPTIFLATAHY